MIFSAVVILLNGCAGQPAKQTQNRFGSGAGRVPSSAEQDAQFVGAPPSPSPSPGSMPQDGQTVPPSSTLGAPSPTPPPATTRASTTTQEMPYATPVPGKPGLVTSPFAPYAGYVDVRGYPPGQEVKCPYTGKLFRVP